MPVETEEKYEKKSVTIASLWAETAMQYLMKAKPSN